MTSVNILLSGGLDSLNTVPIATSLMQNAVSNDEAIKRIDEKIVYMSDMYKREFLRRFTNIEKPSTLIRHSPEHDNLSGTLLALAEMTGFFDNDVDATERKYVLLTSSSLDLLIKKLNRPLETFAEGPTSQHRAFASYLQRFLRNEDGNYVDGDVDRVRTALFQHLKTRLVILTAASKPEDFPSREVLLEADKILIDPPWIVENENGTIRRE
tara:strand:- start:630 stop:1265 length:636 start_codon:yes stop_codon:yes gene_type:complete